MGRALKIQKTNNSILTDAGYPNFGSLTNPVYNSAATLSATDFLGVVGGSPATSTASATFPEIAALVNISLADGTDSYTATSSYVGRLIRQKGSHKFLVATTASIDPANAVAGVALRITVVGDTDWTAMGLAPSQTAAIGTVFTPTAAAGAGTTGTAQEVGVCVLTSDLTPSAGNMSISYFAGAADSTEQAISKLTNRFLQNFAGGATGGNANTGDVWAATAAVDNVVYDANFFTDEGTVAKSGAEADTWGANGSEQNAGGTLDLGIVENYTS